MFPEFVYESFHYNVQPDGLHIGFLFRMGLITFEPEAFIPRRQFIDFDQPTELMDTLVFNIGMAELVSYWKSFCPPTVVVRPMSLTDEQIAFWRKLYYHGLGEFFYVNSIRANADDFMTIVCDSSRSLQPQQADLGEGYLVPIGGGKDSVVTLETLKEGGMDCRPLIMNPRGATLQCAAVGGYGREELVEIRRTIDKQLLDLNAKGCLNGHTPFSAMLACYTLLASALTHRRHIALSNESSANESTVVGTEVNHQYSKSLEFENDFRHYVQQAISPCFNYYSFLRPLSELQIARLFALKEDYFGVFKSCNVGSKQDIWCGHCAKCLFAYIILSPFIAPERLDAIFGKAMLDDESLSTEFDQLRGTADTKPFECVGTIDEVNTALSLTLQRWYEGKEKPALLKDYVPQPPTVSLDTLFPEHNLTAAEAQLLVQRLANNQ